MQIQTVDNLIEMDFGAFEGKSADELVEKPEFKEWLKGGMDCRPPQGESVKEVQLRIFKALREIITDMMREDLLHCAMITHGGMIANMLAGFGLPKISPQELQCQPGEGFDIYVTATCGSAPRRSRSWGLCHIPVKHTFFCVKIM